MTSTDGRLTPADFDGIFYGPDSGSEEIFEQGEDFLEVLRRHPDSFFLMVGAITDLRLNGHDELAGRFLARAELLWPETDPNWQSLWDRYEAFAAQVTELHTTRPTGWRRSIFDLANNQFTAATHRPPAHFIPFFHSREIYVGVYAMRGALFNGMRERGLPVISAIQIWADVVINGDTALADELAAAIRHFWADDPQLSILNEMQGKVKEPSTEGSTENIFLVIMGYLPDDDETIAPPASTPEPLP